MTRRVVITGIGIVSCIGNNKEEVLASLKAGKSGISFSPEYAELGFRSHVHGKPNIDLAEARRLGLPIGNTPNAVSDATADIAFGLMLA